MTTQSEALLEKNLINQLIGMGYSSVKIQDGDALVANLKSQLELFNETTFTTKEFDAILNHLAKGNVFEKAKTLGESKVIYESIAASFGAPKKTAASIDEQINRTATSGASAINESTAYQSPELSRMKELIHKMK